MFVRNKPIVLLLLTLVFLLVTGAVGMAEPGQQNATSSKPISAGGTGFKDVQANDPNSVFIGYLAQRDLMKGYPDGGFHPEGALTRAEAAALLSRAAGLKTDSFNSSFKDVAKDHWAASSIEAAARAGYIKGFPDGTFQPDKKLSRAEGVALFLRLSKEEAKVQLPAVQDLNSQHWAANSVAVALDAKMIGLSQDGNYFYPDQAFKRGDLARLLSILVTSEPELSKTSLSASLKVISGKVEITRANGKIQSVSEKEKVYQGDTINTGAGEAELSFTDGSGLLLKSQTILAIKQSQGKAYIKQDGSPGNAIDYLEVQLKQGKMFGALASKYGTESEAAPSKDKTSKAGDYSKLASLKDIKHLLLAAAETAQPWYKTAEQKKVKVKVDMPWGIAAIRGSFWNNVVTSTGNTTSLLEGDAEVSSGGQTQQLSQMQTSAVTAANAAPTAPTQMSATESKDWVENKVWIENRAVEIVNNQQAVITAPPAVDVPAPAPPATTPAPEVTAPVVSTPVVPTVVSNAISQASSVAGSPSSSGTSSTTTPASGSSVTTDTSSSSSPGSSSSSGSSATACTYTLTNVASVVYGAQTFVLTKDFGLTPPTGLGAAYYDTYVKDSAGNYRQMTARRPVAQKIRHLAALFDKPENITIAFYGTSSGYPVGLYGLSTTGNTLTNQATRTISGTITLGAAAAENITVNLAASSSGGFYLPFKQTVTVPAGATSITYSIPVAPFSNYAVYYDLGTCSQAFTKFGHSLSPLDLTSTDQTGIDFTVPLGHWVSGKLSLPAAATQQLSFAIVAPNSASSISSSTTVRFPIGSTEASYQLAVPVATDTYLWYDSYNSSYCKQNNWATQGYYSTAGTMSSPASVTLLDTTSDLTGKDLTVIPGNYRFIRGTVSLPAAATQPVNLRVYANGGTTPGTVLHSTFTTITIPAGSISADYSIFIDTAYTSYNYVVSYLAYDGVFCQANRYICRGNYYLGGTNTTCYQNWSPVSVSSASATGINMTLIGGGKIITGTASLPPGVTPGTSGLDVVIEAVGTQKYYSYLYFSSTALSSTYYLVVPDSDTYLIYNYLLNYSAVETPANQLAAVTIAGSDVSGQNVVLKNLTPTATSGPGGGGGSGPGISPRDLTENTILVNNAAFQIGSADYIPENLAPVLSGYADSLYYRSMLPTTSGLWFNLNDPAITAANSQTYFETAANSIAPASLPAICSYVGGPLILSPDPIIIVPSATQVRNYAKYPSSSICVTKVADHDPAIATVDLDTPSAGQFSVHGLSLGQTFVTLQATDGTNTLTRDIDIIVVPSLAATPGSVSLTSPAPVTVAGSGLTGYDWAAGDTIMIALANYGSYTLVTDIPAPVVTSTAVNTVTFTVPTSLAAGNYWAVFYKVDSSTGQRIPLGVSAINVTT